MNQQLSPDSDRKFIILEQFFSAGLLFRANFYPQNCSAKINEGGWVWKQYSKIPDGFAHRLPVLLQLTFPLLSKLHHTVGQTGHLLLVFYFILFI